MVPMVQYFSAFHYLLVGIREPSLIPTVHYCLLKLTCTHVLTRAQIHALLQVYTHTCTHKHTHIQM